MFILSQLGANTPHCCIWGGGGGGGGGGVIARNLGLFMHGQSFLWH